MRPLFFAVGIWGLALAGCAPDFHARLDKPAPTAAVPAADAVRFLATNSGDADARRRATEALIERYSPELLASPRHEVGGLPGGVTLRLRRGGGPGGVEPSRYESLVPVGRYTVTGVPFFNRVPGVGAPLVGTCKPISPVSQGGPVEPKPISGVAHAVTAVAVYEKPGRVLVLDLYDPHTTGRTAGRGGPQPLAADFTTPTAVVTTRFGPQRRGLAGLFRGDEYFGSAGLFPVEQPTPDKIPIVFVHGLISDPGDFHVLNHYLNANAEVRRRYQLWAFYYPTSLPVVYADMMLRESLEKFIHELDPAGTHPALHRAVLVGHSMGGLLCRLAVSEGGDRFYHHFFSQPMERLNLSASERDLMRRAFYYHACPDVARVVFIATPHRGSSLAVGWLGKLARRFGRLPMAVRTRVASIFTNNPGAMKNKEQIRSVSSMDSLSPRGPTISAVNDVPMSPKVQLNSIIGDRGRGGSPVGSSDGVVPYASSHLPQAGSECIVPAGHTGTLHRRETAEEIVRLLCPGRP